MKTAQRMEEMSFDDLPLFRLIGHRQIWEGLPRQAQLEAVQLLSDLLRTHVVSSQKGGQENE